MTKHCPGPLAGCLRLVALMMWTALGAPALAAEVDLSGTHKINIERDAVEFAAPGFDDRAWPSIQVPGSLRSQGFDPRPDVYWYRITFTAPAEWSARSSAIRLGVVDRSDAVYLNGTHIGGLGQIGPRLSDWHAYAPILPRLYPFAQELLVLGGENVLAIRGAREPYIDDGGLLSGPVALVDLNAALPRYLALSQRFAAVNFALLGVETLILGVVLFLALFRDTRRSSQLFAVLFACYYVGSLERRGVLGAVGFDGPAVQFAANALPALCIPLMLSFVARIYQRRISLFARAVQVGLVAALVSVPQTGVPLLDWWAFESTVIWHALMVVALGLMLIWSVQAQLDGRSHAAALLVGLGLLGAALVADMLLPNDHFETTYGVRLGELGVFALLLSLCQIFGARILGLKSALLRANVEILNTQEQERSRFARDVHDSVGQWLSTIKIKLELLRAPVASSQPPDPNHLAELVADVDHALEETRRVAKDLSPVVLERQGLVDGMRDLVAQMPAREGLSITLDAPPTADIPTLQRNQVYRVFQEAMRNAVTHSGASRIDVSLRQDGGRWRLTVQDNGRGMPTPPLDAGSRAVQGTGMASMRNRALLLHGGLEVTSVAAEGTCLTLSFPDPKHERPKA